MVASHNGIFKEQVLDFAWQLTPTVDDRLAKSQGKTRFLRVHYPDLSLASSRRRMRCVPVILLLSISINSEASFGAALF
jgi:hypothetical protein